MDLYLIRHPVVETAPGICYGRSDVALRDTPDVGAALIAEKLALLMGTSSATAISHVATSPLSRCMTVAQALTNDATVDARLAELDFGRWEGVAWDAIPRVEIDAWAADITHGRPHGGESVQQLADRTASWLAELAIPSGEATDTAHVAITHAGVIRIMTAQALQVRVLTCLKWPVDMTGVCHLTRSDVQSAWALARWNF